ncbi:MAG: hypothetical protein QME06_04045 [Desulfobacterales bacterium]|nr:hypothetical protein [Desulfobacterales bacterium]
MTKKRKVPITKEREVKTYAEMWHTSRCLLKKAQEEPTGSFHQFMASLVFTAFTLEAYLNHVGPKVYKCWSDIERLGPREKLNIIAEKLQIQINYGRGPWQVLKHLFSFRNDIAHGKSTVVKLSYVEPIDKHSDELFGKFAQTEWEKYCTEKNALKAREDVEKIVHAIYKAGQFEHDYPFIFGFQIRSATVSDE